MARAGTPPISSAVPTARSTRATGRPVGGGRNTEASRTHILDAAERCFATLGIEATTMGQIAGEAGLSRSLLYRHFATRDEVVLASMERACRRLIVTVSEATSEATDLAELFTTYLVEMTWMVRSDPVLTEVFRGSNRNVVASLINEHANFMIEDPDASARRLRAERPGFLEQLRPGLTFREALEYVRTFGVNLATAPPRVVASKPALRRYVVTFLIPVLVADPPPVPPRPRRR